MKNSRNKYIWTKYRKKIKIQNSILFRFLPLDGISSSIRPSMRLYEGCKKSQKKGGPRWLDGWAAATGLGSRWVPFMIQFWALGSDGWAAATGLDFYWVPFIFLLSELLDG